ncbi:MAG: carbohydrate kinase family protein [candidate division Zixibacteria bacterium]|nr:carbohydrate kinase family protein [candidate division Zixibacteria bacterium]
MRIAVIGTINRDTVTLADGTISQGWGGMLYNLRALAATDSAPDVFPVANVGRDCYADILSEVKRLGRFNTDYLYPVPENNNHCFLTYLDAENKHEILRGGVRPLVWKELASLPAVDMILVNYISGRDIHPTALSKLRRVFAGPIYIDIHSLTLGKRSNGERYLRAPSSWPLVISIGDFIQMNRRELALLTGTVTGAGHDRAGIAADLHVLYDRLARKRIDAARKVIIITDGARGCYSASMQSGSLRVGGYPSPSPVPGGDSTGCGDCFSAGFIIGWLHGRTLKAAITKANEAGLRCIRGELRRDMS